MENVTFHAKCDLSFERHDETGDVTVHLGQHSVRLDAATWISAIAAMCAAGDQAAHESAKQFHRSIGSAV